MKKISGKMKKSISLALTFAMVFSMFSTWSLPVHAEDEKAPILITEQTAATEEKEEPIIAPTEAPKADAQEEAIVQNENPVTEEKEEPIIAPAETPKAEVQEEAIVQNENPVTEEKEEPTVAPTETPKAEVQEEAIAQNENPVTEEKAELTVTPTEAPKAEVREEIKPERTPAVEEKVFDVKAAYDYIMTLETEEENAYLETLTEEEKSQLYAYVEEILSAKPDEEIPETVSITQAGPFMPAVNVAVARVMAFANKPADSFDKDGNGLALNKNVSKNPDGSYKITLESWTTGSVKTEEKSIPVDITLVIDQSGSMNFSFSGKDNNSRERQNAMKKAVKGFIDSVASKYSETSDHRISLVEFRSDAKIIKDWTYVNEQGALSLKSKINGLSAEGATNISAGMKKAETLMGSGYKYNGKNTERQKVVIVFTDGSPTTSNYFSKTVADDAIESSKKLKENGVTVYSVGIFNGANPQEMYGKEYYDWKGKKFECDGSVGSYWGVNSMGDYQEKYEISACNRFMNLISSNYKTADSLGLSIEYGLFSNDPKNFTITKNFDRTAPSNENYYLSAKNSAELDNIFTTISNQIGTPSINLGTETVLKDTVTPYFEMPANSEVKVYTANRKSDGTWENRVESSLVPSIKGNTVEVKGFDYNKNFVSETPKADGAYGKKLIVEFTVTVRDGFLGGNGVPTNEASSGIYIGKKPIEKFEVPKVDIPSAYELSAPEVYDYYSNIPDKVNIKNNIKVLYKSYKDGKLTGKTVNIDETASLTWQDDFVTKPEIKVTVSENRLTQDSTYTVKSGGKTATANIKVLKPTVSYNDANAYLGGKVNKPINNRVITWETAPKGAILTGVKPSDDKFTSTGNIPDTITAKGDITVNTNTKVNGIDIPNKANDSFVIYVAEPTFTFENLGVYYGNTVPVNVDIKGSEAPVMEWTALKEGCELITDIPAPGYFYEAEGKGKPISSTADIPVTVELTLGGYSANIENAFKLIVATPTVTFKDLGAYMGNEIPNLDLAKAAKETWNILDNHIGEEPVVSYTYNVTAGTVINSEADIPVNVTAYAVYGNARTPLEGAIVFNHEDCYTGETIEADNEFVIHVLSPEFNIEFKNLGVHLGNDFPTDETIKANEPAKADIDWKYADSKLTLAPQGTAPADKVSVEYTYAKGDYIKNTSDIPVTAVINIGTTSEKIENAFSIVVYAPTISFHDSYEVFGKAVDTTDYYNTNNFEKAEWNTKSALEHKVVDKAPSLEYEYRPEKVWYDSENKVTETADLYVNVDKVKVAGTDHVIPVEFVHTENSVKPAYTHKCTIGTFEPTKGEFIIHIDVLETGLKLTKVVDDKGKAPINSSFVFTITGTDKDGGVFNAEVVLQAGESVTINGLRPDTEVTVKENTAWSNRYTSDDAVQTITLKSETAENNITVHNERASEKWLQTETSVENIFAKEAVK